MRNIDIIEESIKNQSPTLLNLLLVDRSTGKNIVWATDMYECNGPGYGEREQISAESVTGTFTTIIQPRILKPESDRIRRTREKGEVFTNAQVCNQQISLIDNAWFGRKDVFNKPVLNGWKTDYSPIRFTRGKSWQDYVSSKRIEICCGEAPYLASRYDAVTGEPMEVFNRIGIIDRKLRVISENVDEKEKWIEWAEKAYKSTYGYEYQGDSLLIARENLLYTFIDFYKSKFEELPTMRLKKKIAEIISWNIWQMDGTKMTVPYSCHEVIEEDITLFGNVSKKHKCEGCEKNDIYKHNGVYCVIKDWDENRIIRYLDMVGGGNL